MPASALDGLAEGEVRTQVYAVTIDDQQGGTVTLTGSNDAPSLDATATPVLATISEDSPAPTPGSTAGSTPVADLLDAAGLLANYSDVDGDLPGIALIATITAGGTREREFRRICRCLKRPSPARSRAREDQARSADLRSGST